MVVIFLDFDGVLNSFRGGGASDDWASPRGAASRLERPMVERLNRIVAATGARIVVSSSWRLEFTLPELRQILFFAGFKGRVLGVTPRVGVREFTFAARRATAIVEWLRCFLQRYPLDGYLILDDAPLRQWLPRHAAERFIQTDSHEGLGAAHVEVAIRILGHL